MMDIHLAPEEPFSSSCELFIIKLCPHSKIQKKHDMKNPTESIPHVGRLHYAWSPATYQKPQSHCYVALLLKSHSWPERDTGKLSAKSSPYPRCCCQDGIEMTELRNNVLQLSALGTWFWMCNSSRGGRTQPLLKTNTVQRVWEVLGSAAERERPECWYEPTQPCLVWAKELLWRCSECVHYLCTCVYYLTPFQLRLTTDLLGQDWLCQFSAFKSTVRALCQKSNGL